MPRFIAVKKLILMGLVLRVILAPFAAVSVPLRSRAIAFLKQ